MTLSSRKSLKKNSWWGQSRRVALLSQFFHHFLQLGWEDDLCNCQKCLNFKFHRTIELDRWINLASWCIRSRSHQFTNHLDIAQNLPLKPHQWGNTIFNLALMCYSVWLGCMPSTRILALHSPQFHMKYAPNPQAGDAEGPTGVGVIGFPRETRESNSHQVEVKSHEPIARSGGDKIDECQHSICFNFHDCGRHHPINHIPTN